MTPMTSRRRALTVAGIAADVGDDRGGNSGHGGGHGGGHGRSGRDHAEDD